MKLPRLPTTITPLSKLFTMIFFITLPFAGFYLGMKYQELTQRLSTQEEASNTDEDETNGEYELKVVSRYTPVCSPNVKLETGRNELEKLDEIPVELLNHYIPDGIDSRQVFNRDAWPRFFRLGNLYFAFYRRGSMNFGSIPGDTERAGVLYTYKGDLAWKILFEIEDKEKEDEEYIHCPSNLIHMWKEGGNLLFLIQGGCGAGSGEGYTKLLATGDGGKNWKLIKCFYMGAGEFCQVLHEVGKGTFSEAFAAYSKRFCPKGDDSLCGESICNSKTGKYEHETINPETEEPEITENPYCHDFELLTINPITL